VIDAGNQSWLTPGVGAVGAASLLSDAGYEATAGGRYAINSSQLQHDSVEQAQLP
jgi:hypothetical protein